MDSSIPSANSVAASGINSDSFAEVMAFDVDVTGDSPATGNHNASVDVSAVSIDDFEYRFRVQAVDDSGCSVSASTSYSSTFSTSGIKTLASTALTWAGGTDDLLRLSLEARNTAGIKYFLSDANADTTCDAGTAGPDDYDMAKSIPGANTITASVSSATFVEVATWDINASGDNPATGDHSISVDVSTISTRAEFRFRLQAIDDGTCGVTASSTYSPTFNSAGIATDTVSNLVWAGGDDRLRLSLELRRSSAGGSRSITVRTGDADSWVTSPVSWNHKSITVRTGDVDSFVNAPWGISRRRISQVI